jgi:hypothetical protein
MLPIASNRRSPHTPNTRSIVSAAESSPRVSRGTLRTRFFDSEGLREHLFGISTVKSTLLLTN